MQSDLTAVKDFGSVFHIHYASTNKVTHFMYFAIGQAVRSGE